MTDADGSFLSRWSRRKAQSRAADASPADAELASADTDRAAPAAVETAQTAQTEPTVPQAQSDPLSRVRERAGVRVPASPDAADAAPAALDAAAPTPTLDDVERLTPDADFSPFVDPMVQPEVRNAAMKKLFADPHFNVMDGLDVYIDDYNKTEPMPRQWLRQLVQARVLGLLDDEVEEQPRPDTSTLPAPASDAVDDVPQIDNVDEIDGVEALDHVAEVGEAGGTDAAQEATRAAPPPDTPRPYEDTDLPLQQDDAARHDGARAAPDDDADGSGGR